MNRLHRRSDAMTALVEKAKAIIDEKSTRRVVEEVRNLVAANDDWRGRVCLNLDAAESADSPIARLFGSSDFTRRSFIGDVGQRKNVHAGSRYFDEVEALTLELGKKVFRCNFFEFRPMTASIADGLVIRSLTESRDTIMAMEKPYGHPTWREEGYAGFRALKVLDIPFNRIEWNIDMVKFEKVASNVNAKLIIVGSSVFLFPHPLQEIKSIAKRVGAKVWYDGAHPLGLIAAGLFQDPLREGADILTGSGKKTLCGPSGGLVIHNDSDFDEKIRSNVYGHVASTLSERFPALAVCLAESLEFGRDLGTHIIRNAKALGAALDDEGIEMVGSQKGYTESHTLAVRVEQFGPGDRIAEKLEQANMIVSPIKLKTSDSAATGLRLGTAEMTRFGMKEEEMAKIGRLIRRVVKDGENPRRVSEDASELRKDFLELQYCFR